MLQIPSSVGLYPVPGGSICRSTPPSDHYHIDVVTQIASDRVALRQPEERVLQGQLGHCVDKVEQLIAIVSGADGSGQ
jgi:hypothetical protein